MKIKFFDPGKGYSKIKKEINAEIQRVLSAGDLILRADVEKFEATLAKYVGTDYAVALNSGTDALYLALRVSGIGEGDRVLVPAHTFVATAQVVAQLEATPVLYDLDQVYVFGPDVRAIIPVHIAGEFHTDMKKLMDSATSKGVIVIEDACQALGAIQSGIKAGAWGHAGCFSFYPAKILGSYGDAGALVTDDETLANEVREMRNHRKGDNAGWGINSRMDNIQAAILNVKFTYLTANLWKRAMIAEKYTALLGDVILPAYTPGRVWQDYIIQTDKRDELYYFLKREGIETMKNEYPFPISKRPLAVKYESETLRLPCNENLIDEEIDYVIKSVKEFYAKR
jgi:dTDP-4-amino-4,6-dideoxygalactose transaminase